MDGTGDQGARSKKIARFSKHSQRGEHNVGEAWSEITCRDHPVLSVKVRTKHLLVENNIQG